MNALSPDSKTFKHLISPLTVGQLSSVLEKARHISLICHKLFNVMI